MNNILNSFVGTLLNSYANLIDEARWLLGTFIVLEMVFFGVWWALGADNRIVHGIKKLLKFGFWIWLVINFPTISQWLIDSFTTAGFRAVGAAGGSSMLTAPGFFMDRFFISSSPIISAIGKIKWYEVGQMSLYGLALIGLAIAYLVMAAQVFLVTIEFYIVAAAAVILLPFGVFKHTSFLGEKAIGAIISFGIKYMILALLIGLVQPVLASLVPVAGSDILSVRTALDAMFASAVIAFLFWHAPGLAAGLLSGSPTLGAGTAAQSVLAGSMLMGIGAQTMLSATRSAATAAGGAAAIGTRAVGAVGTGAQIAYHASQMGGASTAASALAAVGGGVKAASSSLVRSTVGRSASRVTSAVSQAAGRNMRMGGRDGWAGSGGKLTSGMRSADAADYRASSGTGTASRAPAWASRAMHAMRAVPDEARPMGGSAGFKLQES